jgi:hypothetical protein
MAECDGGLGRLAARHVEPRHEALGRGGCAVLGLELHHARDRAETQPRQRVHDRAQTRIAGQRVAPFGRLVAVHREQKIAQLRSAQHRFDLGRQRQRVAHGPLRQHARMHHQQVAGLLALADLHVQRHVLPAQPFEHRLAVGRGQQVGQRVLAAGLACAVRHAQQMQVVVAQQAARRGAVTLHAPQHRGRVRAPVHEVAQQHDGVAAGREIDLFQQPLQGRVAALDVADQVK